MASSSTSSKSEFLVNGKYRLIRKIGSGSFGDIYLGINVSNGEVSCIIANVTNSLWLGCTFLTAPLQPVEASRSTTKEKAHPHRQ